MKEKILSIIQDNYYQFTGTNEADLLDAEEIAKLIPQWKSYPDTRPEKEGFYFVVLLQDKERTYFGSQYYNGRQWPDRSSFFQPIAFMEIPEFKPEEQK